jgi:hypothetical protein
MPISVLEVSPEMKIVRVVVGPKRIDGGAARLVERRKVYDWEDHDLMKALNDMLEEERREARTAIVRALRGRGC